MTTITASLRHWGDWLIRRWWALFHTVSKIKIYKLFGLLQCISFRKLLLNAHFHMTIQYMAWNEDCIEEEHINKVNTDVHDICTMSPVCYITRGISYCQTASLSTSLFLILLLLQPSLVKATGLLLEQCYILKFIIVQYNNNDTFICLNKWENCLVLIKLKVYCESNATVYYCAIQQ